VGSLGGLHCIPGAMSGPEPYVALRQIVGIFFEFWSGAPEALVRLQGAAASDAEFAAGLMNGGDTC